jgi:hypothetical protein
MRLEREIDKFPVVGVEKHWIMQRYRRALPDSRLDI